MKPGKLKSRLGIFERDLLSNPKGHFKVWKAPIKVAEIFKVDLFLHAVVDSKVCYRLSTKYAPNPSVQMALTVLDPSTNKNARSRLEHHKHIKHFGKKWATMINLMESASILALVLGYIDAGHKNLLQKPGKTAQSTRT